MSSYTEIDTALLDLDFTNPRIQKLFYKTIRKKADQENYLLCC